MFKEIGQMKDYGPATFGELNAEDYDELHDPGTTAEAVEFLAELAGKKNLELAIGTGRIALPLSERGLVVHGLDASPQMLEKLKEKPGGEDISVSIADMADFELGESFNFAYLVFNTIFNLTSQRAQVNCFQSVAKHLEPGGSFLVETQVPDLTQFVDGQSVKTRSVGYETTAIETAVHNPVDQTINYQIIRFTPQGSQLTPLPWRYAYPAELDLMAELAGMQLESRWGGWDHRAFDKDSKMHISLYRRP